MYEKGRKVKGVHKIMAQYVIKRDGSKEEFDAGKMRNAIETSAREAGLEENRILELVEQVGSAALQLAESKEEIATSELREKILSDLDAIEPSVSKVWRQYDEARGRA